MTWIARSIFVPVFHLICHKASATATWRTRFHSRPARPRRDLKVQSPRSAPVCPGLSSVGRSVEIQGPLSCIMVLGTGSWPRAASCGGGLHEDLKVDQKVPGTWDGRWGNSLNSICHQMGEVTHRHLGARNIDQPPASLNEDPPKKDQSRDQPQIAQEG